MTANHGRLLERGDNVVRAVTEFFGLFHDGATDLLNQLVTVAGDFVVQENPDRS